MKTGKTRSEETMTITNIILTISATLTALTAGLFFSWSVAIVWGLGRLSDTGYVSAMQSINRAIQNPIFFAAFFGPAILLPIVSYLYFGQPVSMRFKLLLAASFLYLVGVIGVTVFGNVPMNNRLDAFDLKSGSKEEIEKVRTAYEKPWNNLNHVRAVSSTLAILLVILACLRDD